MACEARPDRDGRTRCVACRIVCDRDDTFECGRSTQVGHAIAVPLALVEMVRSKRADARTGELNHIAPDIWYSRQPVAQHSDFTSDGMVTYGLVLINDANQVLVHDGTSYDIPVGTLYKIDGRVTHETRGDVGLFAALIWDMPAEWELSDFAAELSKDGRFIVSPPIAPSDELDLSAPFVSGLATVER